jgi:hypothetical protein
VPTEAELARQTCGKIQEAKMKEEEKCAAVFLTKCFGVEPKFEPRGEDTPPDFSIGRRAFEVRRLNQRFLNENGVYEPLEAVDFRISPAVDGELKKIAFSKDRGTFWWGLRFQRPLGDTPGKIARQLAELAGAFYRDDSNGPKEIEAGNVVLDVFRSADPHGTAFVAGYRSDNDSGGFDGAVYPISIRLALEEKIKKTHAIAAEFDRWALVLVDYIGFGTDANDIRNIDAPLEHFNSIVVINWDGTLLLEWPNNSLTMLEA